MIRFLPYKGPLNLKELLSEVIVFSIFFSIICYIIFINKLVPYTANYIK